MSFWKMFLLLLLCACLSSSDAAYPSRSREGQLLDIMIPKILIDEFEYVPTAEGYRYSYKLPDGTSHEEVGIITNPGTANADLLVMGAHSRANSDSTTMFTADRFGMRPRVNVKNRKLSPKSLASLAG